VTRSELEHAIRAACDVADDTEVYVLGSQAILGQFPNAPETLRQSAEADVVPKHRPERAEDREFVRTLLAEGMVKSDRLIRLLGQLPQSTEVRERLTAWVRGTAKELSRS